MADNPPIKYEEDAYPYGIPLSSVLKFAPTSPTSASWESSTPSEESEEWNFPVPVNAHASESPFSGEGDEPVFPHSYPHQVSSYPGDTFLSDDVPHALPHPSSIIAPRPLRHVTSASLLAADPSHHNPSLYPSQFENVEPSDLNVISTAPSLCVPWDLQSLAPPSEERQLLQQYELSTSYHLP